MPVFVHHPLQHPFATIVIEVGINIREIDTVGVQETLKQQVVLQWVDSGDAQAICHGRTCRRTTARTYNHAQFFTGSVDEVRHDKEVTRETHGFHHMEFEINLLQHVFGNRVAIKAFRTIVSQLFKIFSLEFDAINLVESTKRFNLFHAFLARQCVVAFLVGRKLLQQVFLGVLFPDVVFGAKVGRNREVRHDWSVLNAIDLYFV